MPIPPFWRARGRHKTLRHSGKAHRHPPPPETAVSARFERMPCSDGLRERRTPARISTDGSGRRCLKRRLANQPVYWLSACCLLLSVLSVSATSTAAAEATKAQQQLDETRGRRAGSVAGLEGERISLAKFSGMLTSSVHMEVRSA